MVIFGNVVFILFDLAYGVICIYLLNAFFSVSFEIGKGTRPTIYKVTDSLAKRYHKRNNLIYEFDTPYDKALDWMFWRGWYKEDKS